MSTAATSKRNSSPSSLITTPSTSIKNGNDTAASRRTRRAVASGEVVKSDIQKSDKTGESSPSIQYNASPVLSAPSSATRKRKTNSLLGPILTRSPSAEKGAPLSSGTRNSARKSSALLSADIKLSPVLMDTKLLYEAGAIPIPNDQMDMDLDQPKETNGAEHNEEDQSQNDDNNTIETGNTPIRSKRRRGTRQNYAEPDDNDFSNKKQKTSLDMSNRNQIVIPSDNSSTGSSSVSPPHDSYIKSPSVPSSVSPPPHSPRDTSAQPNSRNQRVVSVIREYDVASDNDEENVADIIEENDDADVVEAKLYIQVAKVEAKELKSCVENVMKRYYDLKLRELNHEISLVEKGIHPEFIKESMNLDSMKAAELKKAENKLRHSVHSCEDTFEGCVKAANDTFTNNRRLLRNNLLSQKSKYKWQLKSEHESYNTFKTPSATYITPIKLANKKRLSLECAANAPSGLSESVGDIPSWTRRMIKKMRRGGRDAVLVPSTCIGLSESEQADDKMFIDLLVEKKS